MTEAAFQEARKIMMSANFLRGKITEAKGEVAKWTNIEDSYRQQLRQGQADGAKKCLDKALDRLNQLRLKFAEMKFPDTDMQEVKSKHKPCEYCGHIISGDATECSECDYPQLKK